MLHTALLMLGVGIFAGIMGSILGIGGGMIVTPIVTLAMGLDIKYAIGASIIAVIATSSGSTIAFLKDDVLNLRVAMFLEIATTIGAIIGALLTGAFEPMILYILAGTCTAKCEVVKKSYNKSTPINGRKNSILIALIMIKTLNNKSIIKWKMFPEVS